MPYHHVLHRHTDHIIMFLIRYKREPSERGTISLEQVFRAMGLFSAWVSLIRFFEYESRFYVLIIAMRASLTHVARFILVVFPLYE